MELVNAEAFNNVKAAGRYSAKNRGTLCRGCNIPIFSARIPDDPLSGDRNAAVAHEVSCTP